MIDVWMYPDGRHRDLNTLTKQHYDEIVVSSSRFKTPCWERQTPHIFRFHWYADAILQYQWIIFLVYVNEKRQWRPLLLWLCSINYCMKLYWRARLFVEMNKPTTIQLATPASRPSGGFNSSGYVGYTYSTTSKYELALLVIMFSKLTQNKTCRVDRGYIWGAGYWQ